MNTYFFSLHISSDGTASFDDLEKDVMMAGCLDATLSLQGGRIILDFARAAMSRESAVFSALRYIRSIGLVVERVEEALPST